MMIAPVRISLSRSISSQLNPVVLAPRRSLIGPHCFATALTPYTSLKAEPEFPLSPNCEGGVRGPMATVKYRRRARNTVA